METFKPFPQCNDCITNLALTASKISSKGDPDKQSQYHKVALQALENSQGKGLTSPELANRVMRAVREVSGVFDPYYDFKIKEMQSAQNAAQSASEYLGQDLKSLVSFAALGNSLDFFQDAKKVLTGIKEKMQSGLEFYQEQVSEFSRALDQNPEQVLFLSDNSGEIYFDLPLIEYVSRKAKKTILVVKGGPALNDLTKADLRRANLKPKVDLIADTGADGAGVDWEHISPEFEELLNDSQMIIAKGMANWETVFPKPLPIPVFFLFKVKCEPLQKFLSAPPNSYWALWRKPNGSK